MEFGSSLNVKDKQKLQSSAEQVAPTSTDAVIDVNMEAAITPDEVMRAGGFGARDDISSFLPLASDCTDFEAHLHEGQDYKDLDQPDPSKDIAESQTMQYEGTGNVNDPKYSAPKNDVEVYIEASVVSDELNRAGGFGARDEIGSFLPVASDFTDFEANIRGAKDYEELDEQTSRPGLGWSSNNEIK